MTSQHCQYSEVDLRETSYGFKITNAETVPQGFHIDSGEAIVSVTPSTMSDRNQTHHHSDFNYAYPLHPTLEQISARAPNSRAKNESGPSIVRNDVASPLQLTRSKYVTLEGTQKKDSRLIVGQPGRPQYEHSSLTNEEGTNPSLHCDQSIYIRFDDSNSTTSPQPVNRRIASFSGESSVIDQQRRGSGKAPLLSSRRIAPSYYSQQTMNVSPIPEESGLSGNGSLASSSAIPSNWALSTEYLPCDFEIGNSELEVTIIPTKSQDNQQSLVRQASLGRKSKPILTNIKGPVRSRSNNSSDESVKDNAVLGAKSLPPTFEIPQATPLPESYTTFPTEQDSAKEVSCFSPSIKLHQDVLQRQHYPESPPDRHTNSDTGLPLSLSKELEIATSKSWHEEYPETQPNSSFALPAVSGPRVPMFGRRMPPRLNIEAVRDAEARGSLTSLPDLIRRATKLAAVLETGRPDSRWVGRGSWFDRGSSSRSNGNDTDSISDILASFPPPVLAQPKNLTSSMSQWPLPGDCGNASDSSLRQMRTGRRICGLPLWAFILLVLLALVVITAAVVVPLQLVNLSKNDSKSENLVTRCKETNPCLNEGENIATKNFCGCVCTNGFTGASCSQREADSSCTTFDFDDRAKKSGTIEGIQNATIGSALPRLLNKSEDAYNIVLDASLLLGVFSAANLSCTLQNALVNFNGKTQPTKRQVVATVIKRQRLTINIPSSATPTTTSSVSTLSSSRDLVLDEDAIEFGRVSVLYVAQTMSMSAAEAAQESLSDSFRAGIDFGNITSVNFIFQLNDRSIVLPNGKVIGGVTSNSTAN